MIDNKKGVSLMVSYVLLVIIALGLAILVFSFLRVYVPSGETPECSKSVELILQEVSCSSDQVQFTLLNRGLFTVDAVSIRIREEGRKVATVKGGGNITIIFSPILTGLDDKGLPPGQSFLYPNGKLPNPPILESGKTYDIEIQPQEFIGSGNKIAVCEDSIIRQSVTCTDTGGTTPSGERAQSCETDLDCTTTSEVCCTANQCVNTCRISCSTDSGCPGSLRCAHSFCLEPCVKGSADDNLNCNDWAGNLDLTITPQYSCQHGDGNPLCENDEDDE
tara:strand:- start:2719 stop:3549 length:831 start_codon:yes stop_codon:yes gene_type:complete